MLKAVSLFISFLFITACTKSLGLGTTYKLRVYENEIEMTSWYDNGAKKTPIDSLKQLEMHNLLSIHREQHNLSFYSTKNISECFTTENSLEKKVSSLISAEFLSLFDGHDLGIYFLPNSNFKIVHKKKINSSEPLNFVFPVNVSENCTQSLIANSFKSAVGTIIHELFHLHTYKNRLPTDNFEGELLAYTAEFCNHAYAINATKFSVNEGFEVEPKYLDSDSTSLRANYSFQSNLKDTYMRIYSASDKSDQQKATLMMQKVCGNITDILG